MVSERDKCALMCIIKHCNRIENKIINISYESFLNDEDVKEICCFNLLQIGEVCKNLSDERISQYNQTPWKKIKGMRDKVVHGYGTIDMEIVWITSKEDVGPLHQYCEQILNSKD